MKNRWRTAILLAVMPISRLLADDIVGVQPAALDQPQINAAITVGGPVGTGSLLIGDFGLGVTSFNITAYLDTGASGVLISSDTADSLNLNADTYAGQTIVYSDVGVVGSDNFNVSQPIYVNLAPFTPSADVDNQATYQTVYTQSFGPIRTQIGPLNQTDPNLAGLDVLGTPVMHNKVVVIDPRPANSFIDTSRVNIYNPGDPNIPTVGRHVLMTKTDFSQFTLTTPSGAPGPTLGANPIIGRDPTMAPQAGDPPGVTITLGSHQASGNFLFDTGSAASMISTSLAGSLDVRYVSGTKGTDSPQLEMFDPLHPSNPGTGLPDQFTLQIGGIGGTSTVAGFYLDSLLLPTQEGLTDSSKNLNFLDAPVLVSDITAVNPNGGSLTLDGVFGMNLIEPSAFVVQGPNDEFPTIGALTPSSFNWITYQQDYDSRHAMLGLDVNPNPPPPGELDWLGPFFGSTGTWDTSSISWLDLSDPNIFVAYTAGKPVVFNDSLTDITTINIVSPVSPYDVQIQNDIADFTFTGAAITGTGGLTKSGSRTVTFSNQNTYTGLTDIQQGTVVFAARQNIGAVLIEQSGHLVMNTTQNFAGMNVDGGNAVLTSGHNKVLVMAKLIVSGNGKLDINDNKMILDSTTMSLDDLRDMLKAGYNNGAWNGIGLTSSTDASSGIRDSIGYIDNHLLHRTSFGGESVTDDSILIGTTYAGDANFDGVVDMTDVYILSTHWLSDGNYWFDGDFNYDGVVDARDLGIIALNWQVGVNNPLLGEGLPELADSLGLPVSALPDPTDASLIPFLALGAIAKRRTRAANL